VNNIIEHIEITI